VLAGIMSLYTIIVMTVLLCGGFNGVFERAFELFPISDKQSKQNAFYDYYHGTKLSWNGKADHNETDQCSAWISGGAEFDACGKKIDFVVSWVNGSDPTRLETIEEHWPGPKETFPSNRWRHYGSLYYALISLERNAPWANKIYLLTSEHQFPRFYDDPDLAHIFSKVVLVNDDEIWPDKSELPSFNSHAFEMHVGRIPGLSECFIYMCDDFFLARPAHVDEFFELTSAGELRPIIYLEDHTLNFSRASIENEKRKNDSTQKYRIKRPEMQAYANAWFLLVDNKILAEGEIFQGYPWPGLVLTHAGRPVLKSQWKTILEMFPVQVANTSRSTFRQITDLHPFGLYYWWKGSNTKFLFVNDHPLSTSFHMMGHKEMTLPEFTDALRESVFTDDYLWLGINDDVPDNPNVNHFLNSFNVYMSLLFCERKTFHGIDVLVRARWTEEAYKMYQEFGPQCGFQTVMK